MASADSKSRLQALRRLLEKGKSNTQEELREQLEKMDFVITQSTVSRDLRRIGAIRMTDGEGRTVYGLPLEAPPAPFVESLADLVRSIRHNGAVIVVQTTPGSASLVARHIDSMRTDEILGTIAGDDTIFIAPQSSRKLDELVKRIEHSMQPD
jgi:transcriptional regulator of arginine metabolism